MVIDSALPHNFTYTTSISRFVECESTLDLEGASATVADRGKELMPLGEYGFSKRFGCIQAKYGVIWQLNLLQARGLAARNFRDRSCQAGAGVSPDPWARLPSTRTNCRSIRALLPTSRLTALIEDRHSAPPCSLQQRPVPRAERQAPAQ